MIQGERLSVTGVTFIGKLQQLAITQTYFDPVATLKPGVYRWQNVK